MTTASELFHNRRTRISRSSQHLELVGTGDEPDPPLHRISHHPSRRHHRYSYQHQHPDTAPSTVSSRRDLHRLELDGFDNPPFHRRFSHLPRPRRPPLLPDRESGWLDQGSSYSSSEEVNISQDGRTLRERLRPASTERLPGTVLLARERLLQRLRGVSLSANRQRSRVSSSTYHNDVLTEDDTSLANGGEWENEVSREWLAGAIPLTDILSLERTKRPAGLTQEALDSLQVVVFSKLENSGDKVTSGGLEECSICLESFLEGDKLTHLTCGHRFHCFCLDPWVRICGDCPYCRKAVLTTTVETEISM